MGDSNDVSGCGGCLGTLVLLIVLPVALVVWIMPPRGNPPASIRPDPPKAVSQDDFSESAPVLPGGVLIQDDDFLHPERAPGRLGPLPEGVKPAPSGTKLRDRVTVFRPGDAGNCPAATDRVSFLSMRIAITTRDMARYGGLRDQDRVRSIDNGTRCVVVDVGDKARKVRVVDGPTKGLEAWVEDEFVVPRE